MNFDWISLKFVPKGPINNIPVLVQIMAWRRPGDKPLSEAMMVNLPTHICVFRPQWVKFMWWFPNNALLTWNNLTHLPSSAACMRQWIRSTLVQIIACRFFVPNHYLNQCWIIVNWTLRNKLQRNSIKIQNLSFMKMHLKISSVKRCPFGPRS